MGTLATAAPIRDPSLRLVLLKRFLWTEVKNNVLRVWCCGQELFARINVVKDAPRLGHRRVKASVGVSLAPTRGEGGGVEMEAP